MLRKNLSFTGKCLNTHHKSCRFSAGYHHPAPWFRPAPCTHSPLLTYPTHTVTWKRSLKQRVEAAEGLP